MRESSGRSGAAVVASTSWKRSMCLSGSMTARPDMFSTFGSTPPAAAVTRPSIVRFPYSSVLQVAGRRNLGGRAAARRHDFERHEFPRSLELAADRFERAGAGVDRTHFDRPTNRRGLTRRQDREREQHGDSQLCQSAQHDGAIIPQSSWVSKVGHEQTTKATKSTKPTKDFPIVLSVLHRVLGGLRNCPRV